MSDPLRICITICATKNYCYALCAQSRMIVSAILNVPKGKISGGEIVLVGDHSEELKHAEGFYKTILPDNFKVTRFSSDYIESKNYGKEVQKVIAQMRSVAFSYARKHDFDLCWSLDSDVLPSHNSLNCMIQMLEFDNGYYDVACCPYPSQGGGDFLGGRGTDINPILPDVYEDERLFTTELKNKIEEFKKELKEGVWKEGKELDDKRKSLADEIQKMPAKGDVFFLNSHTGVRPFVKALKEKLKAMPDAIKIVEEEENENWRALGFRRRGWYSSAFPGIGLGAITEVSWFGFGNNLIKRKPLSLATFESYDGKGTEDVFVISKKWRRNGIRMCCLPHCPADHVIRGKSPGEYILLQTYHETVNAECVGHLRYERRPWYQQVEGETVKPDPDSAAKLSEEK